MELRYCRILEPQWNGDIKGILESIEKDVIDISELQENQELHQEWWKLSDDNDETIGFGWIDTSNGDVEISLVIKKEYRQNKDIGAGSFILSLLEKKVLDNGYERVCVRVKWTNPNRDKVIEWFYNKGYRSNFCKTLRGHIEMTVRMEDDITMHKQLR